MFTETLSQAVDRLTASLASKASVTRQTKPLFSRCTAEKTDSRVRTRCPPNVVLWAFVSGSAVARGEARHRIAASALTRWIQRRLGWFTVRAYSRRYYASGKSVMFLLGLGHPDRAVLGLAS